MYRLIKTDHFYNYYNKNLPFISEEIRPGSEFACKHPGMCVNSFVMPEVFGRASMYSELVFPPPEADSRE
jgi:hypothetical protein